MSIVSLPAMEQRRELITHPGIVIKCADGMLRVRISSASACSSCHAKGSCTMTEMEDKIIDVPVRDTDTFELGQQVTLAMDARTGWLAVLLAYVLPFVILLLILIIVLALTDNQGAAGLAALGILAPYYFLLYVFRRRLRLSSRFRII